MFQFQNDIGCIARDSTCPFNVTWPLLSNFWRPCRCEAMKQKTWNCPWCILKSRPCTSNGYFSKKLPKDRLIKWLWSSLSTDLPTIKPRRDQELNKKPVNQTALWPIYQWVSVGVMIVTLLMTFLAAMRLGGDLPDLPQIRSSSQAASKHPFQTLVNRPGFPLIKAWPAMKNEANPFFTDFFKPAPKPAPPPKPTMKQAESLQ